MPNNTLLIARITAKDMEKNDEVIQKIKEIKSGEVKDVKKEPIGFGVEIIKAGILIDSKDENAVEKVLKEIREIEEVEDAETEGMTLL